MTIKKKIHPLLRYTATSFVMYSSNIESVWLGELWRGMKWDPGPQWKGAPGTLYRGSGVHGCPQGPGNLKCNWKSDNFPTWAVSAGCSAWYVSGHQTQHKSLHTYTHKYELYDNVLKGVYSLIIGFFGHLWGKPSPQRSYRFFLWWCNSRTFCIFLISSKTMVKNRIVDFKYDSSHSSSSM